MPWATARTLHSSLTHLLTYSHYLLLSLLTSHLLSLLTHLVEAGAGERRPRDKEITWPVVARLNVRVRGRDRLRLRLRLRSPGP